MNFKSFGQLTLEEQRIWANDNREAMEQITYDECGTRYHQSQSVLPPQCCRWCKGCPIKSIVIGVSR